MNKTETAWLAGLLEGEGCFHTVGGTPAVTLLMTDRDIVYRVATLFATKVYPVKNSRLGTKQAWRTIAYGDIAIRIMRLVEPHMGKRRRAKIHSVLQAAAERLGPPVGSRGGLAKLKEEYIPLMRYLHQQHGFGYRRQAKMLGMSRSAIRYVLNGTTWGHVEYGIREVVGR